MLRIYIIIVDMLLSGGGRLFVEHCVEALQHNNTSGLRGNVIFSGSLNASPYLALVNVQLHV
jgi:hypothetical protein